VSDERSPALAEALAATRPLLAAQLAVIAGWAGLTGGERRDEAPGAEPPARTPTEDSVRSSPPVAGTAGSAAPRAPESRATPPAPTVPTLVPAIDEVTAPAPPMAHGDGKARRPLVARASSAGGLSGWSLPAATPSVPTRRGASSSDPRAPEGRGLEAASRQRGSTTRTRFPNEATKPLAARPLPAGHARATTRAADPLDRGPAGIAHATRAALPGRPPGTAGLDVTWDQADRFAFLTPPAVWKEASESPAAPVPAVIIAGAPSSGFDLEDRLEELLERAAREAGVDLE
jgi:hypothetical protein